LPTNYRFLLICQVFKISDPKIFKEFSTSYKIFREVFDSGLFGLEIRNLLPGPAEEILRLFLKRMKSAIRNNRIMN
jgi:hypothetical protein